MSTAPSLSTRRWLKTPIAPVSGPSPSASASSSVSSTPPWKATRQPSLRQLSRNGMNAEISSRRPQTTPTSLSLTAQSELLRKPNLHWHLNAAAARALSREQTARLYALFRFYDSSARGDALPSIDCVRLVDIMRDTGMLSRGSNGDLTEPSTTCTASLAATGDPDAVEGDPGELRVETIENLFAQAVLGSMRAYLDADERPALPFPAFCGALLHLAAVKFPILAAKSPDTALQALVAKLDTILEPSAASVGSTCSTSVFESTLQPSSALGSVGPLAERHFDATEGLLHHFPSDGALATWEAGAAVSSTYGTARNGVPMVSACDDFRSRGAFPDVIANFTSDLREQAQLEERTTRAYLVPPELAAQFPSEMLATIIVKFRTFDVLDRGALPRVEMFALLSTLAKPLDLADVHGALTQLVKGSRNSSGDVTLRHLLETLNNIRASRRAFHANNNRKATTTATAVVAAATAADTTPVDSLNSPSVDEAASHNREDVDGDSHRGRHHKTKYGHHQAPSQQRHGSTSSTRYRKNPGGAAASVGKHRKSVAPPPSNSGESESRNEAQHSTSGSHTKKRAHNHIHRVPSKSVVSNNSLSEFDDGEDDNDEHRNGESDTSHSKAKLTALRLANRGGLPTSDNANSTYTTGSTGARGGGGASNSGRSSASKLSDESLLPAIGQDLVTGSGLTHHSGGHSDAYALELSANGNASCASVTGRTARRALEVVLLLGGDHDGAIVSVFFLSLATRELTERSGVLVHGDRVDDQVAIPVLPTQHSLTSALLMLKKRLVVRMGEGFSPRYPAQIEVVDDLLLALQRKEPRYTSSIGPTSSSHSPHFVGPQRELRSRGTPKQIPSPTRSILNSPSRVLAWPLSPEQLRTVNEQWEAAKDIAGASWVRALNAAATDQSVAVRKDLVR